MDFTAQRDEILSETQALTNGRLLLL